MDKFTSCPKCNKKFHRKTIVKKRYKGTDENRNREYFNPGTIIYTHYKDIIKNDAFSMPLIDHRCIVRM
jgi:hypothetical protein